MSTTNITSHHRGDVMKKCTQVAGMERNGHTSAWKKRLSASKTKSVSPRKVACYLEEDDDSDSDEVMDVYMNVPFHNPNRLVKYYGKSGQIVDRMDNKYSEQSTEEAWILLPKVPPKVAARAESGLIGMHDLAKKDTVIGRVSGLRPLLRNLSYSYLPAGGYGDVRTPKRDQKMLARLLKRFFGCREKGIETAEDAGFILARPAKDQNKPPEVLLDEVKKKLRKYKQRLLEMGEEVSSMSEDSSSAESS